MNPHIEALLALAPAGVTAYDTNVPVSRDGDGNLILPAMPYLVVEAPEFHEHARTLDETVRDVDDYFTLRVVGEDIRQARWAAGHCRLAFDGAEPEPVGFRARVDLEQTSPFIVDRDVILPSGESPVFVADRFHYQARPVPSGS